MENNDLERIKSELKDVWLTFFGSFGRLLPIQEKAMHYVIEKKNLLLVSPAASGKTEAVIAPLCQRIKKENWLPPSILYITPTRALVNDLYFRLKEKFKILNLSIARKTQEHNEFNIKKPQDLIITTPEGFDSFITHNAQQVINIRAVCIDELHLYDNTYRGDQLRVLIRRFKRINKNEINFYAMSATIAEPETMGKKYFTDFIPIVIPSNKELRYKIINGELLECILNKEKDIDILTEKNFVKILLTQITKNNKKVLIFCNTRQATEGIAEIIKKYWQYSDKVWVHHASISKKDREIVEEAMHETKYGIMVATTTMELGIDIGDIDAVVFYRPPFSVSSLLQRLGRGTRRKDYFLAYGIFTNKIEKIIFETMFELASHGKVEPTQHLPDLSVAVQQTLSYVYQKKRIGTSYESLFDILQPIEIEYDDLLTIVDELKNREYLKEIGGRLYPDEKLDTIIMRQKMHSNIPDWPSNYEVINLSTGEKIGEIDAISLTFVMQGKSWLVISRKKNRLYVKEIKKEMGKEKIFKAKSCIFWDYEFGKILKKKITNMDENIIPYIEIEDGIALFHFFGPIYSCIISQIIHADYYNPILSIIKKTKEIKEDEFNKIEENKIIDAVEKTWFYIEPFLSLGAYFKFLPNELKLKAIMKAINKDKLIKILQKTKLVQIESIEL